MNKITNDDVVSTDQIIGGMDSALNTLEEMERMIELKKKNNATLAKMVDELSDEDSDR